MRRPAVRPTHFQLTSQRVIVVVAGLVLFALATGCDGAILDVTPSPTATLWPTFTPAPATPTPRPTDTGWEPVAPGIEVRSLDVILGEETERLTLARVDPTIVRFRVLYDPEAPTTVARWAVRSGADLVINAGYFTEEHVTVGLTVSEGVAYGPSYGDYAGMFAVTADQQVSVRWLRIWPYVPTEALHAAVQSFPVLVKPGGILGFGAEVDDGRASRRSIVGQDAEGRILFAVAPNGALTLHALSDWLSRSDLGLDVAINLDGGTSAGLWVRNGPAIDSLNAVPSVIVVDVP
jgi:uncharacterized protein YigE (DUF2233 family)